MWSLLKHGRGRTKERAGCHHRDLRCLMPQGPRRETVRMELTGEAGPRRGVHREPVSGAPLPGPRQHAPEFLTDKAAGVPSSALHSLDTRLAGLGQFPE